MRLRFGISGDDTSVLRFSRIAIAASMAVVVFFGVSGFSLAEPDDTSPMQESTPTEATEVSWSGDDESDGGTEPSTPEDTSQTEDVSSDESTTTSGATANVEDIPVQEARTEYTAPPPEAQAAPTVNATSMADVPREGLLIEYLFDGDAQDTSGNGNHPSTVQNATYDPSRFGQSFEIWANGLVQVASDTDVNFASIREVSIAFWFRQTPIGHLATAAQVPLFGYTTGNSWPNYIDRNIYLRWSTGEICMTFFSDSTCSSGTNYADGQWHLVIQQVAQTWGSSLYVDGSLVVSSPSNYAGTYYTPYVQFYMVWQVPSLRIDNFRYYNRLLSANERQALQDEQFVASCSDLIRNQDETSTDYGGVCGEEPTDGLVAHYTFDGTTLDSGVYANHLATWPTLAFTDGIRGQSLDYNSLNRWAALAIGTWAASFQFSSGMTAAAWVYLENGKQGTIFSRVNGPDGWMYMAANRINESLLLVSMRIDPWNMTNIYLNDTTANHWTHLAIATEGKRMYIYKNGERVFAINGNHPWILPNAAFSNMNDLLVWEGWNMPGLQGRIDEMYFYDRALSPDEIARLYAHTIKPVERLEMLAVSPIDGATDVARLSEVRISFSEALDPVTIGGAFELSVSGTPVPLYSVLGNGNRNVTLRTVSGSFAPDADYELRMSASLASLAWNHLENAVTVSFRSGQNYVPPGLVYDPNKILLSKSIADWESAARARIANDRQTISAESRTVEGDPVDLRTGEFTYENTYLRLSGIGLPYELSAYYRSQVMADGILGHGWRTSYERRVEERPDGTVVYHDERFGTHEFASSGSGTYAYLASYRARLAKTGTGFDLVYDDLRSLAFDLSGRLVRLSDPSGNAISFSYDGDRIVSATDTLGRTVSYTYSASGQLADITAPDWRSVALEYHDGTGTGGLSGDLANVRIRSGESEKVLRYDYSPDTSSPLLSHNLAKLTDASGRVYVDNTYDADDRVVSQIYGTGTISYAYTLGNIHADDTPSGVGSGETIGYYVASNLGTNRRGMEVEHVYDRHGNMTSRIVHDPTGPSHPRVTLYAYDAEHRLTSEARPLDGGTTYAYDARWNQIEKRRKTDMVAPDDDSTDIVERREYDPATDRLTRKISPDGTVTEYVYDERLRLVETVVHGVRLDADSGTGVDLRTTYEYDASGQLIRTIDPAGRAVSVAYEDGRPVSITREGSGASIVETYTYDAVGNPVSATDAEGHVRTMDYDDFDRLTASISAEGITRSLAYDANDNITLESLSSGSGAVSTVATAYDMLDLPVTVTKSISTDVSAATSTVYDANGNVSSVTLPDGMVRRYEYDASDRPVRIVTEPTGTGAAVETRYEYDADGNLTRELDTLGQATTYAYDGYGRLATVTDALGATREYSYDTLGNIVRSVARSASGTVLQDARAEYNSVGNILISSMVDGEAILETRFAYDPTGRLLRRTDPTGAVTLYEYDDFGRLVGETDAEGTISSISYDARSLPVLRTVTGSGGKSVSAHAAYDGDGRLVRAWRTLGEEEYSTVYEYDAQGNIIREIQPDGGETLREYDLAGRLLRETRTGSGVSSSTSYAYDIAGRLLSVTDPWENTTRYEYDWFGRLVREILPDGATTEYTYDPLGRVATTRDPNNTLATNTYDALGRLTRRDIAAGSGVLGVSYETYSYDGLGRLASASDSLGQALSWSYDGYGRLSSEMQFGLSVGYSYDPAGRISALSYPGGLSLATARDHTGRPLSVASLTTEYARYAYSGAELSDIAYPGGDRADLAYDALSRLSSVAHLSATGAIIREDYAYDSEDKLLSDGWETYAYDGLDRLRRATDTVEYDATKRQTTSRGGQYSYDPAGNREKLDRYAHVSRIVNVCKTVKVNGVNTRVCEDETRESESSYVLNSYESNELNQYDGSVRHPDMSNRDETAYAYDANGNMTSDGTYLYGYDYRNRLVRITRASDNRVLKEITYDVLWRKTGWKSNSTSVRLVYAGDRVIEEHSRLHSNPFTLSASYVWGERNSDDIVAMVRGGQTYWYHTDRLGSVLALTNSSGSVVERYSYDAYGVPSVWSDELGRYRSMWDSAVGNTLLYTGRPYDRIVGLYDMRARQYSAELGRFTSRDPIGMADDVNLYAYVANSPLNYVDRFGTESQSALAPPLLGFNMEDVFNSLFMVEIAGDPSEEKTAQLERMEKADTALLFTWLAGLAKGLAKSVVRVWPAVFDEAVYMKNSMGDAMEQIRLGNYKAAIGGGGRASSVNEILRPGGQQIGKVVNRGDWSVTTVTKDEFYSKIQELESLNPSIVTSPKGYQGTIYELPNWGGQYGLRIGSDWNEVIDIIGTKQKIHYQ